MSTWTQPAPITCYTCPSVNGSPIGRDQLLVLESGVIRLATWYVHKETYGRLASTETNRTMLF